MNTKNELPCLPFDVHLKSYVTMENSARNLQRWILQKFNIALKAKFLKDSLKLTNLVDVT
jgi:hypothetical protein